jgi:hypothetical protein
MAENFYTPAARHHLDRRAAEIIEEGRGDFDDLLTTAATADWFGVSTEWLEIGRSKGYGPPFIRLSPSRVRYRRGDVLAWLHERTHYHRYRMRGVRAMPPAVWPGGWCPAEVNAFAWIWLIEQPAGGCRCLGYAPLQRIVEERAAEPEFTHGPVLGPSARPRACR